MGEYRGTVKALINSHIPFNILPTPGLEAKDLAPYKVRLYMCINCINFVPLGHISSRRTSNIRCTRSIIP